MKIWTLLFDDRDGTRLEIACTAREAEPSALEWCAENWHDGLGPMPPCAADAIEVLRDRSEAWLTIEDRDISNHPALHSALVALRPLAHLADQTRTAISDTCSVRLAEVGWKVALALIGGDADATRAAIARARDALPDKALEILLARVDPLWQCPACGNADPGDAPDCPDCAAEDRAPPVRQGEAAGVPPREGEEASVRGDLHP